MPNEQKVTRKLKAILSADVKGYSILMSDDEAYTIRKLEEYRTRMSNLIVANSGRVVDAVGDNLLAEFSSAVDAVQCAVEIQKALKEKNAEIPEDKRLNFRIGINIGDVVQDGDRIYGSGVNVAARIEGLSDSGGVCVSRNVYGQIKDKLTLGYEYLGQHEVKNIKDPVRVYKVLMASKDAGKLIGAKRKPAKIRWLIASIAVFLLITTGVLAGLYFKYLYLPAPEDIDPEGKMTFELPKGPSIAVLPFDNMTGDQGLNYLCDGVSENIISSLSYIPELLVIARNSSFSYKGKAINIQQIGQDLDAHYVMEGSIQKSDTRFRIIVQLIDALTGIHKWSETYDREPEDLLELQDEIAFEVLKAIQGKVKGQGNIRKLYKSTNDFQEYKKLLRVEGYLYQKTPESLNLALIEANELIEMNPKNPNAYALLASSYIFKITNNQCESPIICLGKATEAIRIALSLDETNDAVYRSAGVLFMFRKDHKKGIDSLKKAISLNPNNAEGYLFLGGTLIYLDELEKAVENIKKAFRLNPLPPARYHFWLGFAYQNSRQFDKAIEAYSKSIELDPDYWLPRIGMVVVYGHIGDKIKAQDAILEVFRIRPDFSARRFVKMQPYKNETTRDFIGEGLSKAGLVD